ncbi:NnrU family protein [Psychromarinibacter sp. C21-152]|uniref:NnrU family protein n=1 Tax=Psychromarinibacter sediminicola TaxID=3033385 RepID=A0AAE3NX63_9RHOB|nr:NnrU family protein [Psychromarinibacter sediminicola]MDF0602282.1 NnrU family protein [Psychromarinibacter sediminicola]
MTLLILGIVLWCAAHLFKRLAPAQRSALADRMGDGAKGVVALVLLIAVILMILGYRWSDFVFVYEPPEWGRHLNNLLMLIAVALFGVGSSKSRLRARMRHPMLLGMLTWAVAHLLVNGDLASLLLFGLLGLWAIAEMIAINRAEPIWTPWQGGSLAGDIRLAVISVVVFGVIAGIHTWLGYYPFPA